MNYKISKIENISVSNFHVSGDILYLFDKSMKSLYKISDDKIDLILKRDDLFYLVIWNNIMHISGNIFFDIENNKEMKLEKFNIESEDYIECFVLNDNKLYAKKFTKFNDIVFLKINEDFSFNTTTVAFINRLY